MFGLLFSGKSPALKNHKMASTYSLIRLAILDFSSNSSELNAMVEKLFCLFVSFLPSKIKVFKCSNWRLWETKSCFTDSASSVMSSSNRGKVSWMIISISIL